MVFNYNLIVEAILSGNAQAVREHVKEALSGGKDPVEVIARGLVAAMDSVGSKFEKNEIYVTELLVTARAMHAGLQEIRPYMVANNAPSAGRAVLGTVAGDVHNIGKNLLGMLLEASGFEVIDLGVDVSAPRFVEAVVKHKPHVICLSALLTTTLVSMRETIDALKEAGIRDQVKVIVGGAAVTAEMARMIGADAYAPDAVTGIQLIKSILGAPTNIPSPMILESVFTGNNLADLQEAFSALIDLHLIVVDSRGQTMSAPGRFPECSLQCHQVRTALENRVARDRYDPVPLWSGLKDAFAYRCHAGLIEISYPLIAEMGKVGAIICGHFLMEEDCLPEERPAGVTVLSRQRLEMVCKLLAFIGGRITELSQALVSNRQLEEQRAHFIHFMQRQHQLEEALREAELKALQSQVNPHFMFNALNVIARMSLLHGDFQTEKVVGALARLMRYTLYQVKSLVTVRDEVKAVQDYLLIQETRFQGRITSSVEVSEEIFAGKMPCMILQPLVENACLHGLEPLTQGGMVSVRGWLEKGQVCFEIIDNGVGMDDKTKTDIFRMEVKSDSRGQVSGIGLSNVLRRMQYQFGSNSVVDIESAPGQGTRLKLTFPFQTAEGGMI